MSSSPCLKRSRLVQMAGAENLDFRQLKAARARYMTRLRSGNITDMGMSAGLGWQLGWYCEMGWQLCFMLETPGGMFISAILLVLATLSFGSSLLGLYRCVPMGNAQF